MDKVLICTSCRKIIVDQEYYDEDNMEDPYHTKCLDLMYEHQREHEEDLDLMGF